MGPLISTLMLGALLWGMGYTAYIAAGKSAQVRRRMVQGGGLSILLAI